jgi:6,7-dimethyl-8-ribityllumazine synthase
MNERPLEFSASLDASGLKFALVVSRFNSLVTKELLSGALDAIARHGGSVKDQVVVWAPGSFEIPLVVKTVLERGGIDGVIALGCVLKGSTTHNEHIAAEVTKGLGMLSLESGLPVAFGILTPDTMEQALERAGMKMGNKGSEAALAAIEVARLQKALRKKG